MLCRLSVWDTTEGDTPAVPERAKGSGDPPIMDTVGNAASGPPRQVVGRVHIQDGFQVGFSAGSESLRSSSKNLWPAGEPPQVVQDNLAKEVSSRRVWEVGSEHPWGCNAIPLE